MVSTPSSLGVSCCLLSCYLGLVALVFFAFFFVLLLLFFFQEDPQAFFEFGELIQVRSSRVSIFTKRRTERREGVGWGEVKRGRRQVQREGIEGRVGRERERESFISREVLPCRNILVSVEKNRPVAVLSNQ
ncbi:hypothetical protein LY76DRAFT_6270 [Colletotrichum caudatum]|nr:hypothetical protein LY76DRAFT_6270 [Colletotrichum caudatum]